MAHEVFISHSSKDRRVAELVCAALEAEGHPCWLAHRDIPAGAAWDVAIEEAITGSRLMVLIWSANANATSKVGDEVRYARDGDLTVIPFRLEAVEPNRRLRLHLRFIQWLDALTPPPEQHLPVLVRRVREVIEEQEAEREERARREREAAEAREREEKERREREERELFERAEREERARAEARAKLQGEEEARRRARSEQWRRDLERVKRRPNRPRETQLQQAYVREYVTELLVPPGSPLAGQTLADAALGAVFGLTVIGILRDWGRDAPRGEERLQEGDLLLAQARARDILDLITEVNIQLRPAARLLDRDPADDAVDFFEATVLRGSELNGRTLRGLDFRDRYDLTVLGVNRHGMALLTKLSTITLRFGDVLLLAGRSENVERLAAEGQLLVLEDKLGRPPRAGLWSFSRRAWNYLRRLGR